MGPSIRDVPEDGTWGPFENLHINLRGGFSVLPADEILGDGGGSSVRTVQGHSRRLALARYAGVIGTKV